MQEAANGLLEARPGLLYIQNLGVLVFFLISGHLITSSLMRRHRSGPYTLRDYLLDRLARIFTPLLPLLAILFVIDNLLAAQGLTFRYTRLDSDLGTLLLNATMLFDHVGLSALARLTGWEGIRATTFGTADQLWTVAIEWWIYVSFGILAFAVLAKRLPGTIQILVLLFGLIVPVYSLFRGNGLVLAWIVGMLAALLHDRLALLPRTALVVAGVVVATLAALVAWRQQMNFYHPLFALLFSVGLVIGHLLSLRPAAQRPVGLLSRLVDGLSEISYSVYLVHLSVLFWLVAWRPDLTGRFDALLLLVLLSNVVAVLFYLGFERHYPAVRRRLGRAVGFGA
jgi:peptidoglycan/LPS O-acetylase OafA/YrhL